jgi:hypothetical protein
MNAGGDNVSRRHFVVAGNLSPEAFLATELVVSLVEWARGRERWGDDAASLALVGAAATIGLSAQREGLPPLRMRVSFDRRE